MECALYRDDSMGVCGARLIQLISSDIILSPTYQSHGITSLFSASSSNLCLFCVFYALQLLYSIRSAIHQRVQNMFARGRDGLETGTELVRHGL